MPDGELRRPPQLWEQKLARTTAVVGMGVGGDATALVTDSPTPGTDGGVEPAPVTPPVDDFVAPSTPTLSGTVQGIRVSWNGLNVNGVAYPAGTYVEIHIATSGATFTPSTSTLAGRLLGAAGFFTIGALTAGTTYYVRLVGVDEAGNRTAPSTAASSQTGLTTSSDYGTATIGAGAVSFNARTIGGITTTVGTTAPSSPVTGDIWLDSSSGAIIHKRWNGSAWITQAWGSDSISAGAVTAVQIAAGAITAGAIAAGSITTAKLDASAVTADKIAAGTITGDKIAANTITANKLSVTYLTATDVGSGGSTTIDGGRITSGTITGRTIQSSTGTGRVEMSNGNRIVFYKSGNSFTELFTDTDGLTFRSTGDIVFGNDGNWTASTDLVKIVNNGSIIADGGCSIGESGANRAFRIDNAGDVFSYGIDDNTTGSAANVRVGGNAQLLRSTSTVRLKDELIPATDDLAGVEPEKLADFPASIDPYDVLTVTPTEFRSLSPADAEARMFGFIAEDVAVKLPWAANWDDQGLPSAVEDRPILAALLAVVRDQQQTIADLTARVTALEGA